MIPLLIAGGMAAAGAVGAAAIAKSGNRDTGPSWKDANGQTIGPDGKPVAHGGYNPNAYNYSNNGMSAGQRQGMYDDLGNSAQKREAAQANYAQAQGVLSQGGGDQSEALGLQRDAALGGAPSVAQKQLQAGQDAAMRSQESMRASARGASGVALADYGAAANIAMGQQQANQASGILRAQEMAQARDAMAATAMQARGQNLQQGATMGGWEQYNVGAQMQQREMNDRRQAAMLGASEGVASQQAQMQLAEQAALQRAYEEAERLKQAAKAGQAAATTQAVGMGLGAASGAANALGAAYGGSSTPTKAPPK